MVEAGQGVMVPADVTFAVPLMELSMAGDWLQVLAPFGLGRGCWSVLFLCEEWERESCHTFASGRRRDRKIVLRWRGRSRWRIA
jgi:hypothetical protein